MERTVLITGCSSGIGRATARAYLAEGWTVYATARDEADVGDLADAGAEIRELDVTKPAQCRDVVDDVVDAEGRLDVLVNNAGYAQFGPLEDVPTRELHRQFDVNVYGPHRLLRAALPHMREAGDGTVVNVSSLSGRLATPGMGAYSGSKFAIEAMSDALRGEVGQFGIDVVLVEPGPVETNFDDRARQEVRDLDATGAYDALYETYEDYTAVSGVGAVSPADVADVILEAGVSTDPEPRYTVGPVANYAMLGRLVPDRWRDALFSLVQRLP
jgi:NAD(P)-dependent dehydrogenase (short-subunit alcohol dehydrogenase family)